MKKIFYLIFILLIVFIICMLIPISSYFYQQFRFDKILTTNGYNLVESEESELINNKEKITIIKYYAKTDDSIKMIRIKNKEIFDLPSFTYTEIGLISFQIKFEDLNNDSANKILLTQSRSGIVMELTLSDLDTLVNTLTPPEDKPLETWKLNLTQDIEDIKLAYNTVKSMFE